MPDLSAFLDAQAALNDYITRVADAPPPKESAASRLVRRLAAYAPWLGAVGVAGLIGAVWFMQSTEGEPPSASLHRSEKVALATLTPKATGPQRLQAAAEHKVAAARLSVQRHLQDPDAAARAVSVVLPTRLDRGGPPFERVNPLELIRASAVSGGPQRLGGSLSRAEPEQAQPAAAIALEREEDHGPATTGAIDLPGPEKGSSAIPAASSGREEGQEASAAGPVKRELAQGKRSRAAGRSPAVEPAPTKVAGGTRQKVKRTSAGLKPTAPASRTTSTPLEKLWALPAKLLSSL